MEQTAISETEVVQRMHDQSMIRARARATFSRRGFSDQTIDNLAAMGIEYPEQLLSLTPAALNELCCGAIPDDVVRYRARYLAERAAPSFVEQTFPDGYFSPFGPAYSGTTLFAMTARVGSTWLMSALARAGLAETILEVFNPRDFAVELAERYRERTIQGYLNAYFHEQMRSDTLLVKTNFYDFYDFIPQGAVDRLLPNLKFIYLYRKDLLAQAYSLWRAVNTGVWHLKAGDVPEVSAAPEPDVVAIQEHVNNLHNETLQWKAFFEKRGVTPFVVAYEDLVEDPQQLLAECYTYITGRELTSAVGGEQVKIRGKADEDAVDAIRDQVVVPEAAIS